MFAHRVVAATAALLTIVAAVPMADQHHHHHPAHKRDYVWFTQTEVDVKTVPVTKTIWVEPGETLPAGYGPSSSTTSTTTSTSAPLAYTPPVAPSSPTTTSISTSTPAPPAYTPPAAPTTPTSTYVAPVPTTTSIPTSTYVAPVPTTPSTTAVPTIYAAPAPSSTPVSSAPSSGSSGSGLSGMAAAGTYYNGDLTWYDVGLGACGWTSTSDEAIVAIPEAIFDAYNPGNPNNNPLCGKYVTITGKDGSSYKAKIVDRCPGCSKDDLDLSQDFFNKVTQNGDGRVHGMKWCFD